MYYGKKKQVNNYSTDFKTEKCLIEELTITLRNPIFFFKIKHIVLQYLKYFCFC